MKMEELQRRFTGRSGEIALVSFSVDPENDTPAVLREHAARYHADPSMWTWVTGPTEQVSDTVVRGFRVAMGEPTPTGNGDEYEIMHSSHFVLVDRDGTIRGYYASDPEGVAELTAAAAKLVEEGR
jgi:protein SCO1/2